MEQALEYDPADVAPGCRAYGLLRDPSLTVPTGAGTSALCPGDPSAWSWQSIPLIADPDRCEHGSTICYGCVCTWNLDWFIVLKKDDEDPLFLSKDFPFDVVPHMERFV